MAKAIYKRGERCPATYTAAGTVSVDDVLVCGAAGNVSVGVAAENIEAAETGIVDVGGIYDMPKVSGAVIEAGESVDWDSAAGEVDDNLATSGAGDVADFGVALHDAGNGVTTVEVLLAPGNGTIT